MPETEAVTQSTEGEPALWNAAVRLQARTVKEAWSENEYRLFVNRHVEPSIAV